MKKNYVKPVSHTLKVEGESMIAESIAISTDSKEVADPNYEGGGDVKEENNLWEQAW